MSRPILFAASLIWVALGLMAAAPGIVGGDSPELTAAAFHLGSAHAPGYPLFITLGHLFQLLPVGTIAFRMTFFSIIVQAAAYLVLTGIFLKLRKDASSAVGENILPFLAAGLVFAGPLVFRQLVSPEVFALHLLFVTILLRFVLFSSVSNFLTASFLAGVALSHQHLTLLIAPAVVWAYRSYFKNPARLITALSFFVLGLSPYLGLSLRAVQDPPVNWGNPRTFTNSFITFLVVNMAATLTKGRFSTAFGTSISTLKISARNPLVLGFFFLFSVFGKAGNILNLNISSVVFAYSSFCPF